MRKRYWILQALLATALVVVLPVIGQDYNPEVLFEAAKKKAVVDGDLDAAIAMYREVLEKAGSNRSLAASALVQLGECYERLGDTEARKAYERIVSEYADQRVQVTTAQAKLAAMGTESQQAADVTIRKLDFVVEKDVDKAYPWNVSADGRYLGATDYESGNATIVDLRDGKYRNVTAYGNWDQQHGFIDQSAISRDGKKIAFWHYKYSAVEGNLRVVGADGKGERVLLKGDDFNRGWGIPTDWSPDGKYIAVELEGAESSTLQRGVMDFALVPVDGGEVRVVKTSPFVGRHRPRLVFSPDGRYLAYDFPPRVGARQTDLYVLPVSGGQETAVAEHPARESFAGWTPNGDILFLSDRTGTTGLYRVAVVDGQQSGEPQLLKDGVGDIKPLGVTDAGSLYYSDMRKEQNSYFTSIDFSTGRLLSKPEKVTDQFQDSISMPSWSQDGRYFSYVRHQSGGAQSTVIIRDVASGEEREILPAVTLNEGFGKVRWHSDGKSLLGLGTKGDRRGLFRISIDNGEATLVGEKEGIVRGDWSPDANWLFYNGGEGRQSMIRWNLETGEERAIYSGESSSRNYRVSPDGSLIVFVQRKADPAGENKLQVVSTTGRGVSEIVSQQQGADRFAWSSLGTAWSKDSRYILFVRDKAQPGESELWVASADGGEARKTDLTMPGLIGEISFDPNSDRLAFSTRSSSTEYWVMENFLP